MDIGLAIALALTSVTLGVLAFEIEVKRKLKRDERMITVEEEE